MTKAQQLGITEFPYKEFDSNNNIVYIEYKSGFWYKTKYDSNGNQIYYEESSGIWTICEYDSNNRKIYREDYDGDGFFKYYKNDKLIKQINKDYKSHYRNYILEKILM